MKPQLKTKMQSLLTPHPAKQVIAKTAVSLARKAPAKVVAKPHPAHAAAKPTHLVQKTVIKPVAAKKLLAKKPIGLAQINGASGMQGLLETKDKLHHLYESIGVPKEKQVADLAKSYGVEMDEDMHEKAAATGSNQMIAHAMAERVLLQL